MEGLHKSLHPFLIFIYRQLHEARILILELVKTCQLNKLSETVVDIVDFTGEINWGTSKPNGTRGKVLNIDKIKSLK